MDSALAAVRTLLAHIGANPADPDLVETPARVLKLYKEVFGGYQKNPAAVLKTFPNDGYEGMILLRDIEYFSTCQHHMQPFFGQAQVAYIPNDHITGLSKIPRLIEVFAHRLQNQEELTQQIAETLFAELQPKGVAVVLSGKHMCMCGRGVKQSRSETVTQCWLGTFKSQAELRQEFLQQIS